jgi:AAA+ ATPase superfamily predicted ATPase
MGGLRGAIGHQATRVVERLSIEAQETLPRLFQALVHVDVVTGAATRQRANRSEIGTDEAAAELLEALIHARLLQAGEHDKGHQPTVELAHEALFDAWPQLQDWLRDNHPLLQRRTEIEVAMARWDRENRDPRDLLTGKRLAEAIQLASQRPYFLTPRIRLYVKLSQEREKHMRTLSLQGALSTDEYEQVRGDLEDLSLTRVDPYVEFKPIRDPISFYGRGSFLHRLPAILAQGTHVGIFGLRKVGKTSLINQLRRYFLNTPTIFIDCQEFPAQVTIYFEEILTQLHAELRSQRIKGLPNLPIGIITEVSFRKHFLDLFALWQQSGHYNPFLIILDEIDKFFPKRELIESENILSEYVRFFRTLRGITQSRQCLVTLIIACRPEVNRHNLLTPALGENPTFHFFQEEHLGFLDAADSASMVRDIGLWKQIFWDTDAAQRVFHYCGGHPFVTRCFASHACKRGVLKTINYERVEDAAKEIQSTLSKSEIGNYYREGVWGLLREDEKQVLSLILQHNKNGTLVEEINNELEDALTSLEHLGLVVNNNNDVNISSYLFYIWLQRRAGI